MHCNYFYLKYVIELIGGSALKGHEPNYILFMVKGTYKKLMLLMILFKKFKLCRKVQFLCMFVIHY